MLLAGLDPVALDFWAAKHVLVPTASSIGYDKTDSLNPENTESDGLGEAFGVWLGLTKDELLRSNYNVTMDENRMNIITKSSSTSSSSVSSPISGFEIIVMVLSLTVVIFLFLRRRR